MSVAERWARTDEQIERMHDARARGGRCAWCGRALDDGETVYLERFLTGERRIRQQGTGAPRSAAQAPVGAECASPELLAETAGRESEPCAGCGRGVYYGAVRGSRRRRALCSRRCAVLAAKDGRP